MFTGIVEEIGIVVCLDKTRSGISLKVKSSTTHSDIKVGESIAVDGVCLSSNSIDRDILSFDVIQETLRRTTLGELKKNDSVNLERSLKADSRIGGHFVTGHIDYKGRVENIVEDSNGVSFKVSLLSEYSKFVVEKGSVALDGVSLTVAEVDRQSFTVYLIPQTLKVTTLGTKKKSGFVNVETDLLAKYLVKNNQKTNLQDLLKKYEYI